MSYLARPSVLTATSTGTLDLDDIDAGWGTVAANLVKKVAGDFEADVAAGKNKETAMEACSQARFVAAKVHTVGYIFRAVRPARCDLKLHMRRPTADTVIPWLPCSSAPRSTTCRRRPRRTSSSSTAASTACTRSRSRRAPSSSVRSAACDFAAPGY